MTLRLTMFADIDPAVRKVWLVQDILGDGEESCLFGAPGSGKSVLAGDLAAHVAAGLDWLGHRVTQGAVLYIAAERAAVVKRRLAAWRGHHHIDELPLAVLDGTIDLCSSKATVEEIMGHAHDLRETTGQLVRLIVIDTVSRALAGGDENSPRDMGALVNNVALIQAATGAHVLLLHHVPQDAHRLRGHGLLLGAMDTTIGVEKLATGRVATVEKQSDGEEGVAVSFTLETVTLVVEEDGNPTTTAPVVMPTEGPVERLAKVHRKLPDRVRNALDVLVDLSIDGKPLSNGQDLPRSIKAVPVEMWHDQLYRRGVLDNGHKNPRTDFTRVKDMLHARKLVAERDGQIWVV